MFATNPACVTSKCEFATAFVFNKGQQVEFSLEQICSIAVANLFESVSMAESITHKKCVNRNKCDFATKQHIMFKALAIVEIL